MEWRDINGFEGIYQVSDTGLVKSLPRTRANKGGSVSAVSERLLKGKADKDGYTEYALCKDSKMYYFRAHRLVANAFIDNPNNYPIINHKDENPANNCVDNLEWCTYAYNSQYSIYKKGQPLLYGDARYNSFREASRALNVDPKTIKYHIKHNSP